MADPDPPHGPPGAPPGGAELRSLVQDWITIWHSELAAAATDREAQEAWQTLVAMWADAANTLAAAIPDGFPASPKTHDCHDRGEAGAVAPARPAAADAAPDPRDAEVERLSGRVAELERRLADLERGGG